MVAAIAGELFDIGRIGNQPGRNVFALANNLEAQFQDIGDRRGTFRLWAS